MEQEPKRVDEQEPEKTENTDTVLLRDLAPRQDVKGGSGKLRFGETKTTDIRDDS